MTKRTSLWIQIGIALAALAGSVYVACSPANSLMRWYNIDDAFYYYKVAQNVLTGHGFTFDQINLSNGFHPLWMVVCLGVFWLSWYNLLLPLRVLAVVSGLFNAASAVLMFQLLKRVVRPVFAVLGALLWALGPSIFGTTTVHGMETAVSVFFILLLLNLGWNYLEKKSIGDEKPVQLLWIGLVGALTMLARLDNVFLVGFVGIFLVFGVTRISRLLQRDLLLITVATALSFLTVPYFYQDGINAFSIYPLLALGLLVKPLGFYLAGLYSNLQRPGKWTSYAKLALQIGATLLLYAGLGYVLRQGHLVRFFSWRVMLSDCALTGLLIFASRLFFKLPEDTEPAPSFPQFLSGLLKGWKRLAADLLAYGSPILLLIGGYMIFNKLVFGTFTPVSGQIKHWWSTLANTVYVGKSSLVTVLGLSPNGNSGPWSLVTSYIDEASTWFCGLLKINDRLSGMLIFILFTVILLAAVVWVIKAAGVLKGKTFSILLSVLLFACIFQVAYYTGTGYAASRNWYWVAEMILLVLLGTLLLDCGFTLLERKKVSPIFAFVTGGLLIAGVLFLHGGYVYRLAPYRVPQGHQVDYIEDILELETLVPEGSIIGMTGGGTTAYFLPNRTVVNMDGLINSADYFAAMKAGTATEFLDALPLDYVYGTPYMLLESDPYVDILRGRLVEIKNIPGPEKFTLYRYIQE